MAAASYAWLSQVEAEIKAAGLDGTRTPVIESQDYLINEALPETTSRIDEHCGQFFMPRIETRAFDASTQTIDWYRNQLMLDQPLLSATSFITGATTLTAWDNVWADRSAADYTPYPSGRTPYYAIQNFNANWLQGYTDGTSASWMGAFQLTGVWGYRTRYSTEGFRLTGDAVANALGINSSVTSITVTSVNGALPDGFSPRFSACQLIQIESEWCEVVDTDSATNTLTVIRGARGSTAASHALNTPIYVYYPEPNIVRATIRQASYLLKRRTVFEQVSVNAQNTAVSIMPMDLCEEARMILRQYVWSQGRRV